MFQFFQAATHALLHLGPLGFFLIAFIEESIIPVPSVIAMMAGGFITLGHTPLSWAAVGTLFTQVALPIALGLTLGSTVIYLLGYYFGKPLILKYGKYLTISWSDVERIESYFEKGYSDEVVLTVLRIVPFVPVHLLAIFCGLIRLPLANYLLFTFIGVLIRSFIVAFAGWRLGKFYYAYANFFGRAQTLIGLGAIVVIIAWWAYRRHKQNATMEDHE